MSWAWLAITIIGDVAGAVALERAIRSRHRARFVAAGAVAYVLGFYAFARSLQGIPTSIADAIYFAASTAVVVVIGVIAFRDPLDLRKVAGVVLVVTGVVVLRLQVA